MIKIDSSYHKIIILTGNNFWQIIAQLYVVSCFLFHFFQCLPAITKACWGEEREREKAREEVAELLKLLEKELNEKRFFGGENIGMVDIAAHVISFSLGAYEEASGVTLMTREKFPKLCKWRDEFLSNSATIKEDAPPREQLISYFQKLFRKK